MGPESEFHEELVEIFTALRDLHTHYVPPEPYRSHTVYLPFLVEACTSDGQLQLRRVQGRERRRPRSQRSRPASRSRTGMARRSNARSSATPSTRAAATATPRMARGLDALTIRTLGRTAPPDEDWVDVTYRTAVGVERDVRVRWITYQPAEESPFGDTDEALRPAAVSVTQGNLGRRGALGVDAQTTTVNLVRRDLFARGWQAPPAAGSNELATDLPRGVARPDPPDEHRGRRPHPDLHVPRPRSGGVRRGVRAPCDGAPDGRPDRRRPRQRRRRHPGGRAAAAGPHAATHRTRIRPVHRESADPAPVHGQPGGPDRPEPVGGLGDRGGRDGRHVLDRVPDRFGRRCQRPRAGLLRSGRAHHRCALLQRDGHLRGRIPGPRDRPDRRRRGAHGRGWGQRLDPRPPPAVDPGPRLAAQARCRRGPPSAWPSVARCGSARTRASSSRTSA